MSLRRYESQYCAFLLFFSSQPVHAETKVQVQAAHEFGPETSENEACGKAVEKAKRKALMSVVGEKMTSSQIESCTDTGSDLNCTLFEETIYDQNGQLLSGSFMDYAIPRASDVPNFNFSYNEILCKTNLLGVKGAGEAGAIGAPPAVINAICDALSTENIDMPAKPEKLWNLINSKTSLS